MLKLIIKESNFSYSKRHLFDLLDLLVKKHGWNYISKSDLLNKTKMEKYKEIKHILLITGSSQISEFCVLKDVKISYIIDDLHTGGEIKTGRIKSKNRVYKIFSTYGYCFDKFYPMIDKSKVVFFPHSARYVLEINNKPIKKILIAGRINPNHYPNRYKIYNLMKKYKEIYYEKPKLNGYRAKSDKDINERIYGEKFYKMLNQYLICFTCDASKDRPYLLAKHFEILGSGSLLFSCNPNTKEIFKSLGFIDGEHYVSCTSETMEEKIEWLLDEKNLEEINRIRKNGWKLVGKEHTLKKRCEVINNVLN